MFAVGDDDRAGYVVVQLDGPLAGTRATSGQAWAARGASGWLGGAVVWGGGQNFLAGASRLGPGATTEWVDGLAALGLDESADTAQDTEG